MRSFFGKVALALALAIVWIAGGPSARPAHAIRVDETSVQMLERGTCAAQLEDEISSGHVAAETFQTGDDPSDDPEPDNLGTEREVPGALASFGVTGLDAPHSSRTRHLNADAETAITRAVAPAVQRPRG